MSFAVVAPASLATAAGDLSGIGSAVTAANAAAASRTTSLAAAAQDEVSTAIASLFTGYAREYEGAQRPGRRVAGPIRRRAQ